MGFFASSGILNQRGFFSAPVSAALPAPSGFPDVASTNQISITNVSGTMFNIPNNGVGTYTKDGDYNGSGGDVLRYSFDVYFNAKIAFGNAGDGYDQWYLGYYDDNDFVYSTNPSTDPTIIPTTGWSPSITITAA